ncbi:bifunctional 4-hydroxy-2-oxoglutarate aldolase/2-dehydro-3-deoxy-phosphogluconate aldolase [Actinomadura viridis]|uniref:2-dehydro-3-deoxyphosphogluconate aldolase/(4S)-4-hydroxy-2-oxoglutarate aldolase n=1 Tax=Actinomadura viridis TaxID=58110 RepID=A0A931DU07_9ACTN|nr:bifunctional 4-hydroxy-2-oxoglutarate aldolase/2-dehydro-3-deoxy-phosphogluconate aldolase [Actinomadura viridis]MBG6093871.1 2-dehydro-3-deoxyphosphogluconate aldolase/(4S)-4-hydroxy-2-oxoglutarate aldolase [Actinomadura viridis]
MSGYRWRTTGRLVADRVIGIVRAPDAATALGRARLLAGAGLTAVEISLTTPGALDALRELVAGETAGGGTGVLAGAGTILDEHQADRAIAAGAAFLVCPSLSVPVIRTAHRHGVPVVAGAATPTEIVQALEAGADLVKLFPAGRIGPDGLRAIRQALPQAPLVPTGGVTLESAPEWIAAGAVAAGMGSELTRGPEDAIRPRIRALLESLRTP